MDVNVGSMHIIRTDGTPSETYEYIHSVAHAFVDRKLSQPQHVITNISLLTQYHTHRCNMKHNFCNMSFFCYSQAGENPREVDINITATRFMAIFDMEKKPR